jgi:alkylhydroperoxidase/carboxymuconolactone decarboxylase family protein YurZ
LRFVGNLSHILSLEAWIWAALEAGTKEEEIFEGIEVATLPAGIHMVTFSMPISAEICRELEKGGTRYVGQ